LLLSDLSFSPQYPLYCQTLFTLTPEGGTFRFSAITSLSAADSNMPRLTMPSFIKCTFHYLAKNFRILGGIIHRASHMLTLFPEAAAAGITGMSGVVARHLDIVFAAASLFVIQAACYGAV